MDGKSDDNTVSVLEKYDSWINYWESENDRGQSHAINKGFCLASGKIYCWLNSDDFFTKESLLKVAQTFLKSKAQFVYGNCFNLLNGVFTKQIVTIVFDRYLSVPALAQPSTFWDSEIHQAIWEDLHCTLDYELWMRLAKGAKKKYINYELSVAREHEESKTHTRDSKLQQRWAKDHELQWSYHNHVPWKKLVIETRIIRKIFNIFPFLKRLY